MIGANFIHSKTPARRPQPIKRALKTDMFSILLAVVYTSNMVVYQIMNKLLKSIFVKIKIGGWLNLG